MKSCIQFFLVSFFLKGCANDVDFIALPKETFLHDNGSKVWIIDEIVNSTKNFAPYQLQQKSVIVFYDNNYCIMQPLSTLGKKPLKTGNFELSDDNLELIVNFRSEKWNFKVLIINNKEVILKPKSDSHFPYELRLKTFPVI